MAKRLALLILASLVLTLLITTVALAWTPQDIYNDYAQHGKLTRNYTDAELRAYLNDATLAQYADKDIKNRLDTLVTQELTRTTFPFTGFQIAMGVLVVVVLIGGGVALRLLSRPRRKQSEGS
jgi:hypothetical protein